MKVLQLCLRIPNPPRDGGAIAMYNITKALWYQNIDVHVLAINTPKHHVDIHQMDEEYKQKSHFDYVNVDTVVKPVPALQHLIRNVSYHVSRFYCKKFEQKLIDKIKKNKYDIIQLESLYMTPYISVIRNYCHAKIILRAHNVEHVVWKRLAENENNPITKWYLKKLTKQLHKYELESLQQLDGVVAISPDDLSYFKSVNTKLKSLVFPLSIDIDDYPFNSKKKAPFSIFHLGSMDWFPNIEAVDWFVEKVYPKLIERVPDIKIYLAGKDMPERLLQKKFDCITVEGKIDDPVDYMKKKDVMIVPLFSGSGMRVKIIEGMAMGKVVISTTLGAEGINYKNKENILIADTADEFVNRIEELCINESLYDMISENARQLVIDEYDNKSLGRKLGEFYNSLIPLKETAANPI